MNNYLLQVCIKNLQPKNTQPGLVKHINKNKQKKKKRKKKRGENHSSDIFGINTNPKSTSSTSSNPSTTAVIDDFKSQDAHLTLELPPLTSLSHLQLTRCYMIPLACGCHQILTTIYRDLVTLHQIFCDQTELLLKVHALRLKGHHVQQLEMPLVRLQRRLQQGVHIVVPGLCPAIMHHRVLHALCSHNHLQTLQPALHQ